MTPFAHIVRRLRVPAALSALALALGAQALSPQPWPPSWNDTPVDGADFSPVRFTAPQAADCHRLPVVREVPGPQAESQGRLRRETPMLEPAGAARARESAAAADKARAVSKSAPASTRRPVPPGRTC